MKLSGKLYDRLKFIVQVVSPAFTTLYLTLAGIWGLPAAQEVVGTIVALTAFAGVCLQISSAKFQANPDGHISPDGTLSLKQDSVYDKDKLLIQVHRDEGRE